MQPTYLYNGGPNVPSIVATDFDPTAHLSSQALIALAPGTLIIQGSIKDEECNDVCQPAIYIVGCDGTCDEADIQLLFELPQAAPAPAPLGAPECKQPR